MSINTTGNIPEVRDWPRSLCCNCKNRRNLQVCRDSKKSGRQTIEECKGFVRCLPWR